MIRISPFHISATGLCCCILYPPFIIDVWCPSPSDLNSIPFSDSDLFVCLSIGWIYIKDADPNDFFSLTLFPWKIKKSALKIKTKIFIFLSSDKISWAEFALKTEGKRNGENQ